MEGDEYLEKIVAASYAREVDQEENVFRTLPFAATALAIIFTFVVFIKNDVPGPFGWSLWACRLGYVGPVLDRGCNRSVFLVDCHGGKTSAIFILIR